MKAALYIRVSTVYQIDKDSLPMQKQDLQNYCKLVLGIDDYEVFEDAGYSAKNTDRPAFQNMMERIHKREFTHVIVWKLDRISRNISDFVNMWDEFEKYDVKFISKNDNFQTDSPMGKAMLNIVMTFAQLEREMTSMRVKATMIARAEDGKWNGANIPLGYDFDYEAKFPVPNEEESKLVQLIYDKYEEIKSTNKLSIWLNENGHKTKRGGVWSAKTINQILRNPFYIGTLRYNYRGSARGKIKPESEWVIVENNHQGIIDKAQWERAQVLINRNMNPNTRRIQQKHIHVFSGLLRCYKCGGGFSADADRIRKDGFRPSIYTCSNKGHGRNCDLQGYISDMILGEFVLNYMSHMLFLQKEFDEENMQSILLEGRAFKDVAYIDDQSLSDLKAMIYSNMPNKITGKTTEVNTSNNALLQRKQRLERALQRLDNLFLFDDNAMSEKEYLAKKSPLVNELNTIDMQINMQKSDKNTPLLVDNKQLAQCVIDWKLGSGDYINYKRLATGIEREEIKAFMNMVIYRITIGENRQINEIEFANGLVQKFLYR